MSDDLAEFLLARIAEDEAVARAVTSSGSWVAVPASDPYRPGAADVARVEGGDEYSPDYVALDGDGLGSTTMANAEHMARWDPVRVLAECDSKRRIVEAHRRTDYRLPHEGYRVTIGHDGLDEAVRLLALPYVDHPDYDESWRP
jgi:hypothetical protein